jgi:hypothetical protein
MPGDPILGQNFRVWADHGRAIFDIDAQQQRVLRQMKDPLVVLGKDDDQVPGLLLELGPPALPADWGFLLTRQEIRRGQRKH